jgi:hypothetical protein
MFLNNSRTFSCGIKDSCSWVNNEMFFEKSRTFEIILKDEILSKSIFV